MEPKKTEPKDWRAITIPAQDNPEKKDGTDGTAPSGQDGQAERPGADQNGRPWKRGHEQKRKTPQEPADQSAPKKRNKPQARKEKNQREQTGRDGKPRSSASVAEAKIMWDYPNAANCNQNTLIEVRACLKAHWKNPK